MKTVSDTGPIIGLAKIGKLDLLKIISEEVLIPPVVHKELFGKIGPESGPIEHALNHFIRVADVSALDSETERIIADLDEGEKQAIGLASKMSGSVLLLLDDHAGRRAAAKLKILTTGLVGVLLLAKEKGYVDKVVPLLIELRRNGYWLSDQVIEVTKRLADE